MGVRAAFSVTNGVRPRAETCVSIFDKAVRTCEVANVSRGAFGGSMIRISTVGTTLLDLWKIHEGARGKQKGTITYR